MKLTFKRRNEKKKPTSDLFQSRSFQSKDKIYKGVSCNQTEIEDTGLSS